MAPSSSTIEAQGIKIEKDPSHITPLPPYVEDLRKLLLNFREILPHNQKPELELLYKRDKDLLNKKFRLRENIYCDYAHPIYKARWEAAMALRNNAKHLRDRNKEDAWTNLIGGTVFENINHQASDQGILLRDLLSWGSDELFTNAVAIRRPLPDGKNHKPKPDFWFGLGLYNDKQLSRLSGLELKDKGIEYFTKEKLVGIKRNQNKTLICQPGTSEKAGAFPWMVVELKKEGGDEKECLMQAANASYTSLKLCEGLAAPAMKDIPPIIAFTSVGPEAKIFITYKSEEDAEDEVYRFSCIWSGNIEHILHALQIRRIVDQLMYWALRIFKPWVTEFLEHWSRKRTEDEGDNETDDETDD